MNIETLAVAKKYTDRKLHFGTETISQHQQMKELPYRVKNLTIVEDFTDQTGWIDSIYADSAPAILNGEPARAITVSGGSGQSMFKTYDVAPDFSKQYFIFPIYVEDVASIKELSLYISVGSSYTNTFYTKNSVIMGRIKTGWNIVVINKSEFSVGTGTVTWETADTIRLYVTPYEGKTVNITIGKIQSYDMDALCTLWFDDGSISQYTEAFTRMNAKNPPMPGVISVVADLIGEPKKLSQAQMREMIQAGWEMANHTKTHAVLTTIPTEQVEHEISKGLEFLLSMNVGKSAYYFIAPNNAYNDDVLKIIEKYATVFRGYPSYAHNRLPIGLGTHPMKIACREVKDITTVDTIKGWIDTAIQNGLWLKILFHVIGANQGTLSYTPDDFQAVIDYLETRKADIKVVNCSEALYHS